MVKVAIERCPVVKPGFGPTGLKRSGNYIDLRSEVIVSPKAKLTIWFFGRYLHSKMGRKAKKEKEIKQKKGRKSKTPEAK